MLEALKLITLEKRMTEGVTEREEQNSNCPL